MQLWVMHPPTVGHEGVGWWAEGLWGQEGLFAVQLSWGWHTAEIQVSVCQQHAGCTLTAPAPLPLPQCQQHCSPAGLWQFADLYLAWERNYVKSPNYLKLWGHTAGGKVLATYWASACRSTLKGVRWTFTVSSGVWACPQSQHRITPWPSRITPQAAPLCKCSPTSAAPCCTPKIYSFLV